MRMRCAAVSSSHPIPQFVGSQTAVSEHNKNSFGLLARFIGGVVGFVARRPRLILWPVLLVACAAVGITVSDLKLHTSRSELMDPTAGFSESWTEYTEQFGSDGDIVAMRWAVHP